MKKKKIYVPDIECDSCSKLISKKLSKQEGIQQSTLRLRVGMSKTSLSLMLKNL